MTTILQDVRYAIRMMKRAPGFTTAAVATFALGLGLNSAVLSFAHALFLKPLPIHGASRLVILDETRPERSLLSGYPLSYPDYVFYRDQARSLSGLAAHYSTSPMHVATRDGSFGVSGAVVTASYFSLLRLQPAAGRFFSPEEDQVPGRNPVAVISHELWRTRFGADPSVVGADVRINGTSFNVIGVAPARFQGTVLGLTPNDVWIPTAMFKAGYRYCDGLARGCNIVNLIGRLNDQATIESAQTEMTLLAQRLEAEFPATNQGRGVLVRPALGVRVQEQSRVRPIVALLAGAAALVLLVASANVAGLLLARGLSRRREIAIRIALGAARGRLVRQLLVESVVLAGAGALAGLIVAVWATEPARWFFGVGSSGDSVNIDLAVLDVRIVAAGALVALGTGLLTGIAPALQATRRDTLPALKDETGTASPARSRLREGLVVLQLAISVLLLVGSGLLVRSSATLHRGPGFDPDKVVMMRLRPSLVDYTSERAWEYQREVLRRLEALPGVAAASPANVPPLPRWARPRLPVRLAGDAADPDRAFQPETTHVGPRYFKALGGRVLDGRELDGRDTAGGPRVTVVNETLARRLWPRGGAVGSTLTIGERQCEVVGVVDDVQFVSVLEQPEPIAYLSFWQQDSSQAWSKDSQTIVRVSGDATAMLPQIRRAIAGVGPDVPFSDPQTLGAQLGHFFSAVRGARTLLVGFGAIALAVSAIGLYAALAFAVGQRTREIAIRMALGAARADVSRLVLRRGGTSVLLGVVLGLVAAASVGPLLAQLLYGVSPHDPLALLAGPSVLAAVAFLATWLAARRAMSVDPMAALRSE